MGFNMSLIILGFLAGILVLTNAEIQEETDIKSSASPKYLRSSPKSMKLRLMKPEEFYGSLETNLLESYTHTGLELKKNEDTKGNGGSVREARKINFFRGMLNKPKSSPLYLINGTVCRFVNLNPICTTLSTTGLLQTNTAGGSTSRPSSAQFQSSSVEFVNQPRPAAIIDDNPPDINVALSNSNSSENGSGSRGQTQPSRLAINQAGRPMSFVISRGPTNLLAFRRPIHQYQLVNRRTVGNILTRGKVGVERKGLSG